MKFVCSFLITFSLLISSVVCAQEFAYVTDSLKLRLYAEASDSSEVLLSIESGDSVEILEKRNAFSRIITNDGFEGWVKSAFLVVDPPEKLLYYSVSEQNKQLQAEIETLKNTKQNGASDPKQQKDLQALEELQTALSEQQQLNQTLQQQLTATQDNDSEIVSASSAIQSSNFKISTQEINKWITPALFVITLLIGFLLGLKLAASRMRKRLHGFVLK